MTLTDHKVPVKEKDLAKKGTDAVDCFGHQDHLGVVCLAT